MIANTYVRFNSDEKHLHDRIAKKLGISVLTIDQNIKKKLVNRYAKRIH